MIILFIIIFIKCFSYNYHTILSKYYKGDVSVYRFFDSNIKIEIPKPKKIWFRSFETNYTICNLLFNLYSSGNLITLPEKVYIEFQKILTNFIYKNRNYNFV